MNPFKRKQSCEGCTEGLEGLEGLTLYNNWRWVEGPTRQITLSASLLCALCRREATSKLQNTGLEAFQFVLPGMSGPSLLAENTKTPSKFPLQGALPTAPTGPLLVLHTELDVGFQGLHHSLGNSRSFMMLISCVFEGMKEKGFWSLSQRIKDRGHPAPNTSTSMAASKYFRLQLSG